MRLLFVAAVLAFGTLAGCAAPSAPSNAADATAKACTAQAEAQYNASTVDLDARPTQSGLQFGATPNHVFDAEQMGAEHQRDSAITACEHSGDTGGAANGGSYAVTPHIVSP